MVVAAIVLVAVALRVALALYMGDGIEALPGITDQVSYDTLARQVLAGRGFTVPAGWWPADQPGDPTAHWSYLYVLYVSAVYSVFGPHPIAARLIQALLAGVLHPWLTWRLGARLFGAPVGLLAAGLVAVYSYFVYYAGAVMTETFYILAILWALDLATRMAHAPGSRLQPSVSGRPAAGGGVKPWLLLGLALGAAVLLRQVIILFVPLLLAWVLWAGARRQPSGESAPGGSRRQSIVGVVVAVAVVAALIAPWTVRNYLAFGRFVPLNTNAGYAFFWANHPIYGTSFTPILPSRAYYELIPPDLRGLDEAALDQALLREGLRFVADDPVRYARLSLSRIGDYFAFWPSSDSSQLSNVARLISFGILLPFMLLGLLLSGLGRRRYVCPGQGPAVALLVSFVAAYSLIHILSWALTRYRLPVDAILVVFAALALADLAGRLSGGRLRRTVRWAGMAE